MLSPGTIILYNKTHAVILYNIRPRQQYIIIVKLVKVIIIIIVIRFIL